MKRWAKPKNVAIERTWFENLDATRFFGFFHVFLAHCFFSNSPVIRDTGSFQFLNAHLKSGFLGLDYFFVLSAFLLTWLGLEEIKNTGAFHPLKFIIRRGLRLWPLYFLLVGAVYIVAVFVPDISSLPPLQVFLLFYANIWMAEQGQNFLFILVFFWSISAEEQFYLLWALVLKWLPKALPWLCLLMMVGSILFRYQYVHENNTLSFHTLSILGNFGTGGLAAWLTFNFETIRNWLRNLSRLFIALLYSTLIFLTVFYFWLFSGVQGTVIEKQVFALLFAFIILEQCFSARSFIKFGQFSIFNYLGRISLGLYCYHGLVLTFATKYLAQNNAFRVFLLNPLIILALTLLLSILSYELFEKRVHGLRRFFYPKINLTKH